MSKTAGMNSTSLPDEISMVSKHAEVSEPKTRIQFAHASKMKDNMELESAMSSSRRVIKDGRQDGKRKDPKMAYREP
ncbi:hypothetical protein PtA15_2A532 [Puccinia triticina]|uniref:Uncharacterized protein n=1 Tax=Puccinia triticina TaxID=208348 RepID=A0ABY7CBS0_9BASI|nr:uncharacterized protein PtA15_2A532 [Puccinia triticina]WAQ82215.1 hypothetical protein PtA15_2A532 [Puccinia triticina]